jgi:hypothetical protein
MCSIELPTYWFLKHDAKFIDSPLAYVWVSVISRVSFFMVGIRATQRGTDHLLKAKVSLMLHFTCLSAIIILCLACVGTQSYLPVWFISMLYLCIG